jgi:3-deoxy-D-arabino-heptulosonate 7-phosphate (DAHP) synthase class II
MRIPKNIKDVQNVTGRLAALNRFISKSVEQSLPIFQALKGSKRDFVWGPSQKHAFQEIKKYLL